MRRAPSSPSHPISHSVLAGLSHLITHPGHWPMVCWGSMARIRAVPKWLPTAASQQHAARLHAEAGRLAAALAVMDAQYVVLFGSVARGDIGETSDLDLLVVIETPYRFVQRAVRLAETLRPTVPVDFLVYTPAEFAQMRDWPFVRTALREGQVLHAVDPPAPEQGSD